MLLNNILNRIKYFIDLLVLIDSKIGFKKFTKYCLMLIFIISLFNIKSITANALEYLIDVSEELHSEKMDLRDQYMNDLGPLLAEFRANVGADRVLYFEYHNSEGNLEGVPFKFFDLMKCNTSYGSQDILGSHYKDVGAGMYSELFNDINKGKILVCNGIEDTKFRNKYKGVFELFNNTDNSKMQVFFSVPGVKKPIGFIVVEWMDDKKDVKLKTNDIYQFLPRVSAIGVSRLRSIR